ncbi:hypothetical protein COW36_04270 [bacterium (Candidatus Blackallbacteria) CG17_big_fil_post_rev_8_21_14_2_50_48_46]|uniref:Uncharacterized protein n=1 Tax=bacterium (Candidatus Blackallbacteria) CG17_big_fil_post_rev_8_21_14_2_50_48_46 TaxID=2014261 RepID=A0A2M7G9H6_9BACT|nr:MAG: hypothetical protein COW64_04675 [bacterium (Candidatus Blackallbacteria) CG18_big_fil_WC_8_21_14_2_50_49_26]PIW18514.1 MAG: hypothetical protein COW36_04270 [bacterium (Candidatus Blackallbacteria) CG17_big_fil_post_rev_8_21_14_2_50_48_46]PIW46501.1 MAG: hypothetical protein COW20_16410 [bacterium (Candidatus Blackallbacteria) CG13_big_fil_rev_8_21_14_2_50_49_14]
MHFSVASALNLSPQVREHHPLAETEIIKGLRCLAWAQEAGFDPPELLTEAALCFAQALQMEASNCVALEGLLYTFLLVQDYPRAQDILDQITVLQPQHPDLKNWMNFLLETPQELEETDSELQVQELDSEWLYDETERRIEAAFISFTRLSFAQPVLSTQALAEMEAYAVSLEETRFHVQNMILQLEQEMDTTALCLRLEPLDICFHNLEEMLKGSYALIELRNRVYLLEEFLNLLLERAGRMPGPVERAEIEFHLEDALDRSDRLHAQLQECQRRHWPVDSLLAVLDKTRFQVEFLQELLDAQR